MDLILILAIGAIVTVTGIINPSSKEPEDAEKSPSTEVTTQVAQEVKPEPEPAKEPEPEPEPAKEPEPTSEPQKEEPKEHINSELIQEQDAKPEEEEVTIDQ